MFKFIVFSLFLLISSPVYSEETSDICTFQKNIVQVIYELKNKDVDIKQTKLALFQLAAENGVETAFAPLYLNALVDFIYSSPFPENELSRELNKSCRITFNVGTEA